MSFFARLTAPLRAFPEYQYMINEVRTQLRENQAMADETAKAFNGEEFTRYASKQKPGFQKPLYDIIQVGISREKGLHEVARDTARLADDFEPIFRREEEVLKWRKLFIDADAAALKAEKNAAAAHKKLQQAQASGHQPNIDRCESEYGRLKRTAEDARASADHTKAQVADKEEPYKREFLQLFTDPLAGYIERRIRAAEEEAKVGENMRTAAEQLEVYEDPRLAPFQKRLDDLEAVEREEFGNVYVVDPVKDF